MKKYFGLCLLLGSAVAVAGCDTVCLTAPVGAFGLTGCNGSGPGSGNGDSNPNAPGQLGPLAMTGTPTINGAIYVDGVPINIYSGNALCIDLRGAFTGGRGPWRIEILRNADESLVLGHLGLDNPATCFLWEDLEGRLSGGFYIIMLTDGGGHTLKWLVQIVVNVVGGGGGGTPGTPVGALALNLTSPAELSTYHLNNLLVVGGAITGGSPPFTVKINLYDGNVANHHIGSNRSFSFSFLVSVDTDGNWLQNRVCVYSGDGQSACLQRQIRVP